MAVTTFKDLEAWKQGIELAMLVYDCTDRFPNHERFGLSSRMCRAALSIPSNLAEGHCKSPKEFLRHVSHSRGYSHELTTLTIVARRRCYGIPSILQQVAERADREGKLLFCLQPSLR